MKNYLIACLNVLVFIASANYVNAQPATIAFNDPSIEELLDMKISTAAKYEQTVRDAPAPVSIITSEDIAHYGWQTIREAILSQSGFYGRDDRNYIYLGNRGFEQSGYSNKILVMLDGHTINENIYESPGMGTEFPVAMYDIERIEIVRGPGSSLYGANAMLAVVNVITKKPDKINGLRIAAKAGSWNNSQGTLTIGKAFGNGLNINASGKIGYTAGQDLYYKEYDDSSTNNGWARGLDWERVASGFVSARFSGLELSGFAGRRSKGIPTGAFEVNFNDPSAQTTDERAAIEMKYNVKLSSRLDLTARAYYDYYDYKGVYPYDSTEYDGDLGKWAGSELQVVWDPSTSNRFTSGVEFKNNFHADYRIWHADRTLLEGNFPYNIFSVYAQDQWQIFSNLNLVLGLRHDDYTIAGSATTPRASLLIDISKNSVIKAIYGQAFRAPNIYELYYRDYVTIKNNPDLAPETINTYELVWQQQIAQGLTGSLSYYFYQMNNLIDVGFDPVDSLFQYQNIYKVNSNGVELNLNYNSSPEFSAFANYTYNYSVNATTKAKLTDSPSHLLKAGATVTVFDALTLSPQLLYESGRITGYATNTNPYFLVNLFVSYSPKFINNAVGHDNFLSISLKMNNIFNVDYALPGGLELVQPAIAQNGRNFLFYLSLII